MNYYQHHIGDYSAATGHLSWDEDMAYTRLLRAYYHAEKGIPAGQQYRLARATTPAQKRAVDAVLAEFFALSESGSGWTQKRAEQEIADYREKQSKASASAKARWSRTASNAKGALDEHTERNANAYRTQCEGNANQEPRTKNQEPIDHLANGSRAHARGVPTLEQCQGFAETQLITAVEAEEYWNAREASGWTRSANGATVQVANWQADLKAYTTTARNRKAEAKAKEEALAKRFTGNGPRKLSNDGLNAGVTFDD